MSHLSNGVLLDLIENQRFGVEYQPIVNVKTDEVVAYEALSRFYDALGNPIRPDLVYSSLHDNPLSLYQVEYAQKCLQLQHMPNADQVFVNLDQDAFYACGGEVSENPILKAIQRLGKGRVVVELIENSEISDALMSLSMIETFSNLGIETALDDLCNPKSMLSVAVMQLVEWIKLDKHVLKMQDEVSYMIFVSKIIDFAHATGKRVILEGVETERDLVFAKCIGVDFVQGFFYREGFIRF
ncbi:EAL domain-containing protein [Marinomonas pollencensis]|uniref:EAL domain-containing protein (Putative c-di-GMP-specific phosphodiesterase class I) n=1 Tax=Marinomonas pollencensis TaxID=491954 RepID=A0A3E0DKY8_9GAMM|nr:EAL domain-containing protein [Marinomonas pollencensis]REG83293.1 EAL domain-containing protein (putative c-di-GMP-specific phosphodiesterase class I) [Marinomonas pollencensis]